MPDTCLDTTRSTSPDVRLLKVAEKISWEVGYLSMDGKTRPSSTRLEGLPSELLEIAAEIRADIHRPSQQAHDLIQLLHRASSEGDAWAVLVDCATTVRGLSDADRLRVAIEALIALARQREPGK